MSVPTVSSMSSVISGIDLAGPFFSQPDYLSQSFGPKVFNLIHIFLYIFGDFLQDIKISFGSYLVYNHR